MKLFLISQSRVDGYNTYDSAVVAAESESDARNIHPCQYVTHAANGKWMGTYAAGKRYGAEYCMDDDDEWPKYKDIDCVKVEYLGETDKQRGVILASFNAG